METISTAPDMFPIGRIAAVLGRDVRELRRAMADRAADGESLVAGNFAKTYLVSSLPDRVRRQLETLAQARGYDSPEKLLQREAPPWEHALPISEIHPEEIVLAKKRAKALAVLVREYSAGDRAVSEIFEEGAQSHRRDLGYTLTAETIGNIFRRVIGRDSGRQEFERWELFLPETPRRVRSESPGKGSDDFAHFEAYLEGIDPTRITLEARSWAWTALCDNLQILVECGEPLRNARRRLVKYAFARAPWLSRSKQSLAKCLDQKWARYCAGEKHLADRRPAASGNRRPLPLTEDDEKKLIALSLGGGVAQAWRNLHGAAELSSEAVQHFAAGCASKSYVPRRVRELVTPKVKMLDDIHHGPRRAKLNGAYITRDWSKVLPGDWYQADDTTLPLYWYEVGPDGKQRAIRGQSLFMIDNRCLRVLAFALHSDNNYNARVIRGLVLQTHDTYGLPRKGFYFEKGIWKSSRLITGASTPGDELPMDDTEAGLRDHGIRFVHANLPRGKVVERVIGLLQDRMEHEPGYCGRNEQTEKFERLQRQLQLARAGHIEFSSFLLHRDEWAHRLHDLCDQYNSEHQEGSMLRGLSPREFWDQAFDFNQPLVRLDGPQRYLLANHRRPLRVTKNGLCIQIGKERRWFRNEATGGLIGQTVQTYFNPDDLSSVWVRTGNAANVIVVPEAPTPAAMDASEAELRGAHENCAAHNRAALTLYSTIKPHFPKNAPSHFRKNLITADLSEQSRALNAQQERVRAEQAEAQQKKAQLTRLSRRFGQLPDADAVSAERRLKAMELIRKANRDVVDTQTES